MKTIFINSRPHKTGARNLKELKAELNSDADAFFMGFGVGDEFELKGGEKIIFTKKGELPPREIQREIMSARNSPELNLALNSACVGVAGLGGLGSNVAISLARAGVAKLVIVDFDVVDVTNLNRQQYFLSDVGKLKTTALKQIIEKITPFTQIQAINLKLDENNIAAVFEGCDIVAECFDDAAAKSMLVNSLANKLIVASSGMAGVGKSNEIKTTKFARNLYVCGDLKSAAKIGQGLMAPRVGLCAMHQANLILELIKDKNG